MKRKLLSVAVSAMIITSMLSGCGNKKANTTKDESVAKQTTTTEATQEVGSVDVVGEIIKTDEVSDELHAALNTQPPTLDCTMTTAAISSYIGSHIFEKLVSLKSDYTWDLELAETYQHNEDYTEQTYTIRQGVLFHNGEELTADDVVASLNRWIENYSQAQTMVGDARFEVVDEYTVKISTEESCMYLNDLMAYLGNGFIYPASSIEKIGEDGMLTEYIGTGPYKFTEWVTDQYILLEANESYQPYADKSDGWWGHKTANIKKLYFDIVTDSATRVTGVMNGDYDVAYQLPVDNYDMISNSEELVTYKSLAGASVCVFNKKEGIGTDENFRKAVSMALNEEEIAIAAYSSNDFYTLNSCDMYQSQINWYTTAGEEAYNVNDLEKAKEYLAASSYDGSELRLLCTTDYPELVACAVTIESQLEKIGINVTIESYDWATFLSYRSDSSVFDAYLSWYVPVMVPSMTLYMGAGYAGWYEDETAQGMISQIASSTSMESAYKTWEELQKYILVDSVPYVRLCEFNNYCAATNRLENLGTFQCPTFWNATLYQ